jgi:hypothetical protein
MAVRVTLDHPHRHLGRRVWRRVTVVIGALLVVAGTAATIVAVPANVLTLAWLLDGDVGLSRGMRVIRRGRALVLFLRRFGYDDAQIAVTFAVTRSIGHSWRIVTLDDAEIEAVGVATGTRWIFGAVRLLGRGAVMLVDALLRIVPSIQGGLWGIVAIDLVLGRIWERAADPQAWFAILTPYFDIIFVALSGRLPLDAVAPSLPGVFALLMVALAGIIIFGGAALAAAPVAWTVSALLLFFSSFSADAVREAERGRTREIRTEIDLAQATHAVAQGSRRLFGARLVVLRVATALWQQTVLKLASLSSVALIDVSEPTEHLVWEIRALAGARTKCVFIGRHDRVLRLASIDASSDGPTRRVAELLELEEVLAYTIDKPGRKRFAGALRSVLLEQTAKAA